MQLNNDSPAPHQATDARQIPKGDIDLDNLTQPILDYTLKSGLKILSNQPFGVCRDGFFSPHADTGMEGIAAVERTRPPECTPTYFLCDHV